MNYTTKTILVIACSVMSMSLMAKKPLSTTPTIPCAGKATSGCSGLSNSVSPQHCHRYYQTTTPAQCTPATAKSIYQKQTNCTAGNTCTLPPTSTTNTTTKSQHHKKNQNQ